MTRLQKSSLRQLFFPLAMFLVQVTWPVWNIETFILLFFTYFLFNYRLLFLTFILNLFRINAVRHDGKLSDKGKSEGQKEFQSFNAGRLSLLFYKARHGDSLRDLDELEAQMEVRSFRAAYISLMVYLAAAGIVLSSVVDKSKVVDPEKAFMLLMSGGWLTAELFRTLTVWHYSLNPDISSEKIRYPG